MSAQMTSELDIDALEVLAMASTHGDWLPGVIQMPNVQKGDLWAGAGQSYESPRMHCVTGPADDEQSAKDAAYIAAANPTTILSLIQRLREAEAALRERGEMTQLLIDIEANMRRAWGDRSLSADAWPGALAKRLTAALNPQPQGGEHE